MMKYFALALIVISTALEASEVYQKPNEPKGFHWYNDPLAVEDEELKKDNKQESKQLTPNEITKENAEQIINELQKDVRQLKSLAILSPSIENIKEYKKKQDELTEMATVFSSQWQRTLLEYPELDYNLKYSHYNNLASTQSQIDKANKRNAIKKITEKYGLFYFYRGENPIDKEFSSVISTFATSNNISIVAVSIDNAFSPFFPLTKKDNGIVKRLNIQYFPAVMLVDPETRVIKPLSYGFLSLTDFEKRFLDVSTNFKAYY